MNTLSPFDADRAGYVYQNLRDFKAEMATGLGAEFPVGEICAWPSDTIPDGWLECDGSAISRTTYSDLYGAIGESYGLGDGSTTFNIPDLRGRILRSQNSSSGVDENSTSRTDRGDGVIGDAAGTKQTTYASKHNHEELLCPMLQTQGWLGVSIYYRKYYNYWNEGGLESCPPNMSLKFIIRYEKVQDGR